MNAVTTRRIFAALLAVVALLTVAAGVASEPDSYENLVTEAMALSQSDYVWSGLPQERLAGFVEAALRKNQMLHQRYAEYEAACAAISTVTSLPDPRIGLTEYFQPVETRVGPQRRALSISQTFPWFGSLSAQGNVRRHEATAVRAAFANDVLEVVAAVKQAYFELGYLEQAIAITEQHHRLLTQWEDVARSRYGGGSGSYADVVKAQVELGILADRLAGLRDQRLPLRAGLNALVDRAPESPVELGEMPEARAVVPDLPALTALMEANNPLLAAWDYRAQSSLSAERVAGLDGKPSFTLGLNFIQTDPARQSGVVDSGKDALMGSFSISVPIWRGKVKAAQQVALGRYEMTLSGRRDLTNQLEVSLARVHYELRDASRRVALYESTLLPKGRQSLGATRAAYESGGSSFLEVMDAERLVLEFELSQARARFDVLIQEALIDKLVASPWDGTPAPE